MNLTGFECTANFFNRVYKAINKILASFLSQLFNLQFLKELKLFSQNQCHLEI